MQLQQLHNEIRKLRRDLEVSFEAREDLQDELKEMTQLYLNSKQERDKYKQHMELVRRDADNIERLIRESVERAVRAKDKQIHEMQLRFRDQHEKIVQMEAHKECYGNTIKSLEGQLSEVRLQLEAEQEKCSKLGEQVLSGGAGSIDSGDSIADEKRKLRNLMREDDLYLKKINNADDLLFGNGSPQRTKAGHYDEYETSRPTGGDQTSAEEKENKENVQTTEFDDSADEQTNVRLREDSAQQSMLFEFGNNRNGNILAKSHAGGSLKSAVKLNQVQLDVRKSTKVVRPSSSESIENGRMQGSAKKTSYISGILNSAKKAAGRVTPYQKQ